MESQVTVAEARGVYKCLLDESLRQIVATLSSLGEVERVSLFGSYARGRADLFTDLDVLVVMNTEAGFVERLRQLYGRLAVPVDLDLFCYTPEELRALRERPFFRQMLQDEVVLYEKRRAGGGEAVAGAGPGGPPVGEGPR